MNAQNQAVLAKVEANYGVDAAPIGADDALEAGQVDITIDKQRLDRVAIRASLAALKVTFGRTLVTFSIPCELKGAGAAGTPPDIGPLLQACGLAETINLGVDVQYKPTNTPANIKSATIWVNVDGICFKATGCRGNLQIAESPTGVSTITFTMTGKLGSISDIAVPTCTYQTTTPVRAENMGISIGSWNDGVFRNLNLSSNCEVPERPDLNSDDGLKGVQIVYRDPQVSFRCEAELEATNPFWGDQEARNEKAMDATLGTVAGNIVTLTMPKVALLTIKPTPNGRFLEYEITAQALEDTGADNYTIKFS